MSGTVLIATSSFGPAREALEKAGYALAFNPHKRKLSEPEVTALLAEHRPVGMVAGLEPLNARVLEGAKSHLKAISRCGMGLDTVDLEAARRLGIRVLNTPDAPSPAVAEMTLALMLDALRKVSEADRNLRAGKWQSLQGRLLGDKTVGVVGLGRIGARVARLCGAFGCAVLGFDPAEQAGAPGVDKVSLEELLAESDVVTLHLPLTPATRHLLDAGRLAAMKPGAVLVNAARGGLVDEAALLQALESGRLSAAAVDCFETEPYAGPLARLPNVVLTAHMGSAAIECRGRMEREAVENLLRALAAPAAP